MDWDFLFKSVLLGVIQGLTEFLPVSSSGHLAIAEHYMGIETTGVTLEVALHFGTLVAVFIYFRRDILSLFRSFFSWVVSLASLETPISSDEEYGRRRRDMAVILGIVLGSIPTGIIGIAGKGWFEGLFDEMSAVGGFLLVTAVLLASAEWFKRRREASGIEGEAIPTWYKSIVIGVFQGVAVAPGVSRSGATVSGAMMTGMEPVAAARFSFLLGIPAILGAVIITLPDAAAIRASEWPGYIMGFVAAAAVGYMAIGAFIGALRRGRLGWFALYCFILGSLVVSACMLGL